VELIGRYSKLRARLAEVARLLDEPGVQRPAKGITKQRQRRLTATEQAELIDRYRKGERAYVLAAAFRVHRETVAELLERAGVRRPRSLTAGEIATAVTLYQQAGWSCARIGGHLGRAANTVRLALKAAGVEMRDTHGGAGAAPIRR
jgi:hypothetical protein